MYQLKYFFKIMMLVELLVNSSNSVPANDDLRQLGQGFIENIKSGMIEATSPEIGRAWFSNTVNKDMVFTEIQMWAKQEEAKKLQGLEGFLVSSEPRYCFGVRQSHLFNRHYVFLKKSQNLQTYEQDMALLHAALKALKSTMRTRADQKADNHDGSELAKEFTRRAALSKTVEERNAILFEFGYDEKMSDAAWYFLQEVIISNLCEFDYENTEWLKDTIPLIGWPSLAGYDQALDKTAAFLIHRAYDLSFKKRITRQLEPFYETDEIDKTSYENLKASVELQEVLNNEFIEKNTVARSCHAL